MPLEHSFNGMSPDHPLSDPQNLNLHEKETNVLICMKFYNLNLCQLTYHLMVESESVLNNKEGDLNLSSINTVGDPKAPCNCSDFL